MVANQSEGRIREQLLGEVETHIAGWQYCESDIKPGEQANLEREPENSHDANAIRVENGRFEPVGYLPRQVCSWLAPLVDSGKVCIDGYVPREALGEKADGHSKVPLILSVFLCEKGAGLLADRPAQTKLDTLHAAVRRAYQDAQDYRDADLILGLAAGLEPLKRQELLPETRLLLALIPGMAREALAAGSIKAMVSLRELLGQIIIGQALHHKNLTIFPLAWKQQHDPPYDLL